MSFSARSGSPPAATTSETRPNAVARESGSGMLRARASARVSCPSLAQTAGKATGMLALRSARWSRWTAMIARLVRSGSVWARSRRCAVLISVRARSSPLVRSRIRSCRIWSVAQVTSRARCRPSGGADHGTRSGSCRNSVPRRPAASRGRTDSSAHLTWKFGFRRCDRAGRPAGARSHRVDGR